MTPMVPQRLLDRAALWDDLHRWERSELGKALRRLGLTYGEIRALIPVPKGTLAGWCRDIRLTDAQVSAIVARTGPASRSGIPVDTQWQRRQEIERIREEAAAFARRQLHDSFFRRASPSTGARVRRPNDAWNSRTQIRRPSNCSSSG